MTERAPEKPNPQADAMESELAQLDPSKFPTLCAYAENELFRIRGNISESLDLVTNARVKIRAKIDIPTEKYPDVNFVGKLLGPKGATLKMIQDSTHTRMSILGCGSMRNEAKEKEMLDSGDPKYKHLKQKLHLQIDSVAAPLDAHYNLWIALCECHKVMSEMELSGSGDQSFSPGMRGSHRGGRGGMQSPPSRGRGGGRGRGGMPRGGSVIGNGTLSYSDSSSGFVEVPMQFNGSEMQMGGNYGQNQNWGKMTSPVVRGRGRGRGGHPYAKPGAKN